MPVAKGAVEALREMRAAGLDVYILSAPDDRYTGRCAMEKYQWLEANFGPEWKPRLILTSHKTMVKGDVLIDDKPGLLGRDQGGAEWVHCVFCQPYNVQHNDRPRLHRWSDWREVISPLCCQRKS